MRAVDTNVLVRYLTRDDERQAHAARRLLESSQVLVSKTVLLELEWVLRALYDQTPSDCHRLIAALAGARNVSVEDPAGVARALEWFGSGMDFADALHLASSSAAASFATFDRRLARLATRLDAGRVIELRGAATE